MGISPSCYINKDSVKDLSKKVAKEFAEDFLAAFNDTMIVSNMAVISGGDADKSFINDHYFRKSENATITNRQLAQHSHKEREKSKNMDGGKTSTMFSRSQSDGMSVGSLSDEGSSSVPFVNIVHLSSEWKLQPSPTPFNVIKRGLLIKRGDKFKTFHKRWFHAMNKSHNYAIIYSSDRAGTNVKGCISCLGYTVIPFNQEEARRFGTFGFKLVHQDKRKRTWILTAFNEIEQLQWMEVFAFACRKTVQMTAPTTNSHLLQYIFQLAFHKTRSSYGYFDYCNLYGSEKENLMKFILEVVESNIFDEFFQTFSASRPSVTTKDILEQKKLAFEVSRDLIEPIVEEVWTNRCLPTWASRHKMNLPQSMLTGYFVTKDALEKTVSQGISGIILPVIRDIEMKSIRPLIQICMEAVTSAYREAISSFRTEILTIINGRTESRSPETSKTAGGGVDDSLNIVSGIIDLSNRIEQIFDSPLDETKRILLQMHNIHLSPTDITKEIFQNTYCSRYDIYLVFLDNIRSLYRNALYSFSRCVIDIVQSHQNPVAARHPVGASSSAAPSTFPPRTLSRTLSTDVGTSFNTPAPHLSFAAAATATAPNNSNNQEEGATFEDRINLLMRSNCAGNDEKLALMFSNSDYSKLNEAISEAILRNPDSPIYKLLVSTLLDVLTRLAEDSAKSIKLTFLSIINTIIYSNVQEYVVNPCYDVVCAATKKIEKSLEFIKYINLFYLCGHISDRIISDYILDIINPYVTNLSADMKLSDLGSMNSFISLYSSSMADVRDPRTLSMSSAPGIGNGLHSDRIKSVASMSEDRNGVDDENKDASIENEEIYI